MVQKTKELLLFRFIYDICATGDLQEYPVNWQRALGHMCIGQGEIKNDFSHFIVCERKNIENGNIGLSGRNT